jgi:exopolysaccharide biosynthesis polyprenyl glycosylphosphotransferase
VASSGTHDLLRAVDRVGPRPEGQSARQAGVGPKRQDSLFEQWVVAADVAALVLSFFAAFEMRDRFGYGQLLPLREFVWVLGVIIVLWPTLARSNGLTESQIYLWPRRMFLMTARVHLFGALVLLSSLYLLRALEVSRLFIQLFLVLSAAALAAERVLIRRAVIRRAAEGDGIARRTIIVGTTSAAARFQRLLNVRPHWRNHVAGYLIADGPFVHTFSGKPVLGRLSDLDRLLDTTIVDDVVLAAPLSNHQVDRVVQTCADRGLTFHTLVDMPAPPQARHHAEALGSGLYLMSLERTPQNVAPQMVKRVIDIAISLAGMVVCALVYLMFAPAIALSSPGPVIFRQTRVGRNGRMFTLYKFRTMRSEAEREKSALLEANRMRGHAFKIVDDPRLTRIGKFLRRPYLDELPQFWNVLKGDMSLVGPRPPLPEEVGHYARYHRRRLSVRPGLTGPWQATGNTMVADFEEVVRMEGDYIDQWSLWSDVQLILRTCITVTRMGGR